MCLDRSDLSARPWTWEFGPGSPTVVSHHFAGAWYHESSEALFVGLVVVPTTIWIALAVHYHVRRSWLRWLCRVSR